MNTLEAFGYGRCDNCHGDVQFTQLTAGVCQWCFAKEEAADAKRNP